MRSTPCDDAGVPVNAAAAAGWPRRARLIIGGLILLAACGGEPTAPGSGELVGTWILVSVNEVPAPPDTLTWVFTELTITADAGTDDCVQVGTYTVSGNRITATTTSVSGSGCGDEVGDSGSFIYEVSGDTLTVVMIDPDLGTATFVFERA